MAAFYIRTARGSVGPFTGVELREAALANVIGPSHEISGGPTGPWTHAMVAGLFDQSGNALPHPEGTVVAQYHVRGLRHFARGPFRLRDLIAFSVRRQIHDDAELQSDLAGNWIPVQRIHILRSCLLGELHSASSDDSDADAFHLASSQTDRHDSGHFDHEPESDFEDLDEGLVQSNEKDTDSLSEKGEVNVQSEEDDPESEISKHINERLRQLDGPMMVGNRTLIEKPLPLRERLAKHQEKIVRSLVALSVLALSVTVIWFFFLRGLQPSQAIGEWVSEDGTIGISIAENGRCVVINTSGHSWSGKFSWVRRSKGSSGIEFIEPAEPMEIGSNTKLERMPTSWRDARIGWECDDDQQTVIGGHLVRECFLRRSGRQLLFGFLTGNHVNAGSLEATWIRFLPSQRVEADLVSDLGYADLEPPPDTISRQVPHLSRAIKILMGSQDGSAGDISETEKAAMIQSGCLCYSSRYDAKYLLQNYGIPDQTSTLTPDEISRYPEEPDFHGSQRFRYDGLSLILDADGIVRHCSVR